ncbi:MAG TPA: DUF554 domain-containing protein [Herpetosiphonaceae bacterium]
MILPVGTLINVATVALGTLLGVLIGNRLPERFRETAMAVTGIVTLVLGLHMTASTHNILLTLGGVLIGGMLGEWWQIDAALDHVGRRVEALVARRTRPTQQLDTFAQDNGDPRDPESRLKRQTSVATAFVTASLIFCVGPITILGSIQDGLRGDYQLIAIKSLLDMIASLTLASALGWGVGLSTLTIFVVQGGITLLARVLGESATGLVSERTILAGGTTLPLGSVMLDEMTAAGGILMLGIGLLLLELKRIRVANLIPAIATAPALVLLLYAIGAPVAP